MPLVVHDQNICTKCTAQTNMTNDDEEEDEAKEQERKKNKHSRLQSFQKLSSYRIERTNNVLYCNYSSRSLLRVPV
jgi:hypothetical protein